MRFREYSHTELERCGAELTAHFERLHGCDLGTEDWTEFVLDYFATTARDGLLVDARPPRPKPSWQREYKAPIDRRTTKGEFMLDMTHSSYPDYSIGYQSKSYWDKALAGECRVYLALESEWGTSGAPTSTRAAVLHDAIKLAAVNAKAKVMVYGVEDQKRGEALRDDLALLIERAGDRAPWLLATVPWKSAASQCWVVGG